MAKPDFTAKPSAAEIIRQGYELFGELAKNYDVEVEVPKKRKSSEKSSTSATGIIYGDATTVEAPEQSLAAHYALMELSMLITSHDPTTFSPDKRYPHGCQQRDYEHDKAEQRKVESNAENFNPRYLITDSPTATDGPPITTADGIVLGGNSRTMSLKLATDQHYKDFDVYRSYLLKSIAVYGLTPEDVHALKQPTLVRIVDVAMSKCAFYSNLLNKNLTQGVDVTQEAVSYGRQLSHSDFEHLAELFETHGGDTWAKTIEKRAVESGIIRRFRQAGIITDRNVSEWTTNRGELTDKGKLLVEKTLIGVILPDKSLIESARTYTAQLLRSLPLVIRLKSLQGDWNLIPTIESVIRLESERRASGIDKQKFLNQTSFDRAEISERERDVWEMMDSGPKRFRSVMESYLRTAETQEEKERYGGGMFGLKKSLRSNR